MERNQFVTGLVGTGGEIFEPFFHAALSDFTCLAITNQHPFCRKAAIAIDLFRFEIEPVSFFIKSCSFSSCLVIVVLRGDEVFFFKQKTAYEIPVHGVLFGELSLPWLAPSIQGHDGAVMLRATIAE